MNTDHPGWLKDSPVPLVILRWTARLLSLLALGIVLMFALGERLNLAHFTPRELVLFLFFPLGVCLGLAVAWRWEGWGGAVTAVSFFGFYATDRLMSGSFPRGPFFLALASPALLFLLCSLWTHRNARTHALKISP